jgi:hypothetical protein
MLDTVMKFLKDPEVAAAFARLKAIRHDLGLVINPKATIRKYERDLNTLINKAGGEQLRGVITWLSFEDNAKSLPEDYRKNLEDQFGSEPHVIFEMINANWDMVTDALTPQNASDANN